MITPIQISKEVAEDIASALRSTEAENEQRCQDALRRLEHRRRVVVSKLDRGYDDFVSGTISEEF